MSVLAGAALGAGVAVGLGLWKVLWGAAFGLGVGLALTMADDARRRLEAERDVHETPPEPSPEMIMAQAAAAPAG